MSAPLSHLTHLLGASDILILCSDDTPTTHSFLLTLLSKHPLSTALTTSSGLTHPRVTPTITQPHSCSVCMRRLYGLLEEGCDMCGGAATPTGGRVPMAPDLYAKSAVQASQAATIVLIGHPACTLLSSLLAKRNPTAPVVLIGTEGGEIERDLLCLAPYIPHPRDLLFEGEVGECIARVMSLLQWETFKLPPPSPSKGASHGRAAGAGGAEEAKKREVGVENEDEREKEVREAIAMALAAAAGLGPIGHHSAEDDEKFFVE